MSLMFRLAPALLAVGLTFSAPAGHSAAGCPSQDLTAAFPELVLLAQMSSETYSSDEYIAVEEEQCTPGCGTNMTAALSAGDMPGPMHLPVVAAPEEVAAWHVEIFERVSQNREDGQLDHYCKL